MTDLAEPRRLADAMYRDGELKRGVVACAAYESGQRIEDIAIHECGTHARRDGCIVWLGLYEPDEELLRIIQEQLGLHELMVEDAHQAHQRPKLDVYGDVLFLVLRTAELIDGKIEYGETHVIVGKGFIVSIRHGASASYGEVRRRCERSPELLRLGESFVLYAILDFVADNYFPIIDKIADELETIEDEIFSATATDANIERIYRLRAGLLRMRHAVLPMIEISNQLARHDFSVTATAITPYLHDVRDHALQVNEAIGDLRERLAAAFEASLLLASARQNEIVKKLASWAAILAVPTAIAGIYGMNFKFMPELEWTFGYPVVMGGILAACGYLYYRFRQTSWL
jgi:magnesium transporter